MKYSLKTYSAYNLILLFGIMVYTSISYGKALDIIMLGEGNASVPGAINSSDPEIMLAPLTIKHGEMVSVEGIGFGVKLNSQPQIWDDFENGSDKANISGGWTKYQSIASPVYTATKQHSGQLSVMNSVSSNETDFNTAWQEFERSDETYASYWFRFSISGSPYGVMKLARITSADDNGLEGHYNGPGDFNFQFQTASGWKYAGYNFGTDTNQQTVGGNIPMDSWIRIEIYKKLSTPGENDGAIFVKVDNEIRWSEKDIMTRGAGLSFQHYSFLLPLMFANSEPGAVIDMYVDDVYVDNTQARIEIANCPEFEKCSKSEIQIPQTWNQYQISFKAKIETFDAEESLYLFVINADGIVSNSWSFN